LSVNVDIPKLTNIPRSNTLAASECQPKPMYSRESPATLPPGFSTTVQRYLPFQPPGRRESGCRPWSRSSRAGRSPPCCTSGRCQPGPPWQGRALKGRKSVWKLFKIYFVMRDPIPDAGGSRVNKSAGTMTDEMSISRQSKASVCKKRVKRKLTTGGRVGGSKPNNLKPNSRLSPLSKAICICGRCWAWYLDVM